VDRPARHLSRGCDEPSRIDYAKLAHVSQLLFDLGEALANRDVRPR
jgi:hypothetical protein